MTRSTSLLVLCITGFAAGALAAPPRHTLDAEPENPLGLEAGTQASTTLGDTLWIADWSFDLPGGSCGDAGWVRYDNRILSDGSNWWSVDSRFNGTGGIAGRAAILSRHDLTWARDGYGNDWDYSIVLEYQGASTLAFDMLSDSEPGYDFVQIEADSAGASETRVDYAVDPSKGPSGYRQILLAMTGPQNGSVGPVALPDFGVPSTLHEVYIRFDSDDAYSDEDGLYSSSWNAGLVVDDIVMTGGLAYTEDFESTLGVHVTLANTAPATPFGEWARLIAHLSDNDLCTENTTCAWLFTDPSLPASTPGMAFGPGGFVVRNWLDDVIVSPWVTLEGTPGAGSLLLSSRRFPGNRYSSSRIVLNWSIRSKVRLDNTDTSAPGDSIDVVTGWKHAASWSSLSTFSWITSIADASSSVDPDSREIQIRFRVSDHQYIAGAAPPTTLDPGPGPYIDRVRIGRLAPTGPGLSWLVPSWSTAADGFPSARNSILPGENFSPTFDRFGTVDFAEHAIDLGQGGGVGDSATYNTRDSLLIQVLDVRSTGAVWVSLFASIVSGPHAGKAPPPWTVGANSFFVANADSCRDYNGEWRTDYWYVDLDDEYFRGGDKIVYFWAATDGAGGFASSPPGLTAPPVSVAQAQQATGGLYEFEALPAIDWDPSYLARIAAHPSGKIDPTPAEIANSRQRTNILYVWQRPWARRSGAAHRTAFMYTLDQLGYQDLYDRFFITTYWNNYLGHVAARTSVEQATGYSLIIQDSRTNTWSVLPPPDYRERPVPQVQWYRDWLAQAPMSEMRRATLWLLGDSFVPGEGSNPLVQQDMGVAVASNPQTLLPYPEITGQGTFTWANGDSTDFAGDRLVLESNATCSMRYNTGLAATGTAVVTHRYTLDGFPGDGAVIMNANPSASWNTILGSFSWEDLLDPRDSPPGNRRAGWLDKILTGVLPDSVRALANPTDVAGRTVALPRATVLHQNVPNPFNPATTIRFDLASAGPVRLQVYDVTGRRVRTLVDERREAGWNQQVIWNGLDDSGRRVASGIYLYRLSTGAFTGTRKMIVLK